MKKVMGMYNTVPAETVFFLVSMGIGALSAFLYDLLRISRRIKKTPDVLVNAEDAVFAIAAMLMFFCGTYIKNSGELRWHGVLGFGGGMGLYGITVRNRFLAAGTVVVNGIIKFLKKLISILFFPVRLVLRIFKKPAAIVMWYTRKQFSRTKHIAKRGKDRIFVRAKSAGNIFRK